MPRSFQPSRGGIVAALCGLSFVSYSQRVNIAVAAKLMMPDLSLTQVQMGQIFSSFTLGYALFQVPGGVLGDRFGPRVVLSAAAACWGVATALTGLAPGVLVGAGVWSFVTLISVRFILGASEAATYPVVGRAMANWIPSSGRARSNAIVIAGAFVASAGMPPAISWLMVTFGWRFSFYATSALAFIATGIWWFYGRDYPRESVFTVRTASGDDRRSLETWKRLLRNRNIRWLCLSYAFQGYVLFMYVFWLYLYLTDVRGFSILSGGIFAGLPWIAAAVLTPVGGAMSDALSARLGPGRGRRVVSMSGLTLAAAFLLLGVLGNGAYIAILALSLSVGFLESVEGVFWAAVIDAAGQDAGAAGGLMNMVGSFGGVVSTVLVPVMIGRVGWAAALGSAAAVSLIGGLIWLAIQTEPALDGRGQQLASAS